MCEVEIRIRGDLACDWSDWLGGLAIRRGRPGETVLAGTVRDQAALRGVLDALADLGLDLVSVTVSGEPEMRITNERSKK